MMQWDARSKAWLERTNDRISLWTDRTGNHLEFPVRVIFWLVFLPGLLLLLGGTYFPNRLSAHLYAFLVNEPLGYVVLMLSMMLLFAKALLSGYRTPQKLKAARKRAGLCFACGYDLRESGGRCPECGEEQDKLVIR
jgi:hypothetical protein